MYLEIKGLSKSYGTKSIIEDIDITMDKGAGRTHEMLYSPFDKNSLF